MESASAHTLGELLIGNDFVFVRIVFTLLGTSAASSKTIQTINIRIISMAGNRFYEYRIKESGIEEFFACRLFCKYE